MASPFTTLSAARGKCTAAIPRMRVRPAPRGHQRGARPPRTILPPLPTRPAPLTLARARARGADGRSGWTARRHSTSPRAHPTHVASPCASATSLANGLAPAYTTPTGLSRSATLTSASGASTAVSPLSVPRRLWRGSLTRVFLVRLCGSSSAPASGSSGIAARTRGADAGGSAAVARRAALELELELAVAGVAIVLGATLLV